MDSFKDFRLSLIPITLLIISLRWVNGQISTPCTASMISSVTPCVNFFTGSTSSGAPPTAGCCNSLKSIMGTGMDCACLLITGGVPFQLPINQTLALSLPRVCGIGGVPLQCKASGSPLPAPGSGLLGPTPPPTASSPLSPGGSGLLGPTPPPTASSPLSPGGSGLLGPTPPPTASSPLSPGASEAVAAGPAPESGTSDDLLPTSDDLQPASPSDEPEAPTQSTKGVGRPQLTPSASSLSYVPPPSFLLIILGIMVFKSY